MALDLKLASMARSILEEQASATIQPTPVGQWTRWTRVDPGYQLAQSLVAESGGALDLADLDRAMAILTVAEDAFERYGQTNDRSLIVSISDLLMTTIETIRLYLPAATAEFCAAHLALTAVGAELALQRQDDAFRTFWRDTLIAYALGHIDEIAALPELGTAWQTVDLALSYSEHVVGISRTMRSSWTLQNLSCQSGVFSMATSSGFSNSWWRIQATERSPDPAQLPFTIESVGAGAAPERFLAVAPHTSQLALMPVDSAEARWMILFPSLPARAFGHSVLRNVASNLCLATNPEPQSPAILRLVSDAELAAVHNTGAAFTWRLRP